MTGKKITSLITALFLAVSLMTGSVFGAEITPADTAQAESRQEELTADVAENVSLDDSDAQNTESEEEQGEEQAAEKAEDRAEEQTSDEAADQAVLIEETEEGENSSEGGESSDPGNTENSGNTENPDDTETPEDEPEAYVLTEFQPEEGIYTIHTALNEKKVLESPNGTYNPGVAMQFYDENGSDGQKFRFFKNTDGSYRIVNVRSDKTLEVKNESEDAGAGVVQNFKTSRAAQKWKFFKDSDGYVQIISLMKNRYCLCVEKDKAVNTAKIRTAVPKEENFTAQRFLLVKEDNSKEYASALEEGVYLIRSALDTCMAVDVAGAKKTAAANIQLYKANGSSAQQFIVCRTGAGIYTITNVNSGRLMDTYDGKKTGGTSVVQYAQDGTKTQMWIPEKADRGYYYLKNAASGLYLDVKGGKRVNGTDIQIYAGNKSEAQKFRFELLDSKRTVPDGTYTIHSALSATAVLDIKAASINNTATAQLFTSNDTNAQKFKVTYVGDGYYTLTNENSGKVLDVQGGKNKNSTNVQQYTANGTKAQKWKFVPAGDGRFVIYSGVGTDKVLDAAGGKSKNGTNVQIYTANGTKAQQWLLTFTKKKVEPKYTVEIDPGHQRHGNSEREPIGPGASTKKAKCTSGAHSQWTGQEEYELNLEVSLKLKEELEKRGYKVCMTRTTHYVDISNKERAQIAAKDKADILVRIHADDVSSTSVNGVLNMAPASGNPYMSSTLVKESQRLAKLLRNYQCKATGQRKRDNVYTNSMTGINWATMPVSIVEMGLMSNKTEAYNLADNSFQKKIAKGIADGIDAYFANENP